MKKLIFVLLCGVLALPAQGQEQVRQVEEITVINYGDGRFLFREATEAKTPLAGEHRIIDGYRSECIVAEFENGMYNGLYRHFKNNKLTEEGTYKEGRKDGLFKYYTSSGKLREEKPYMEGKINGIVKSYYLNGKLEKEKGYKMSEEHGVDKYWEYNDGDCRLTRDNNYKDGIPDGRQWSVISSNANGFIKECFYKEGRLDGKYSEIYTEGKGLNKIRQKGEYRNGEQVGKWTDNRGKYDFKR